METLKLVQVTPESLAEIVKNVVSSKFNETVEISHIESPRKEFTGEHYYKYETEILKNL